MNDNDIEKARAAGDRSLRPAPGSNTPRPETARNSDLAAESSEHTSPKRTRRLESRRPPLAERATELAIRVLAYSAVAAMILIAVLLFVVTFGINFIGDQAIAGMKRKMGVAS